MMKGSKRKDGTLEGNRRKNGVTDRVDKSITSNEKSSSMRGVKRKKDLDERKQKKNMDDQVDLSNVSKKDIGRKNKDEASRKKKKHNNQKIEPLDGETGEGGANGNEILEQNQIEKAFGRNRKEVAFKKKHKVQKVVPEEQKCDVNMEDDNGEGNVDEDEKLEQKQRKSKKKKQRNVMRGTVDNLGKTKKVCESKAEEQLQTKGDHNLVMEKEEDEVFQIPSEDENSSQGMTKWIMDYYQSRPGLNVLQEKIDEFITAHEAQEEQERIEKEEQAAEGGWTVVVHHKGRKKTTEAESGTAVGSVALAAAMDKMAKKKNKDVGLDFYRFQKREANRNEIMMLQSKFEQDKKRLQELRAQRKFRPY